MAESSFNFGNGDPSRKKKMSSGRSSRSIAFAIAISLGVGLVAGPVSILFALKDQPRSEVLPKPHSQVKKTTSQILVPAAQEKESGELLQQPKSLDTKRKELRDAELRVLRMTVMQDRLGILSDAEFQEAQAAAKAIYQAKSVRNFSQEDVNLAWKIIPMEIIRYKREASISVEGDKQKFLAECRDALKYNPPFRSFLNASSMVPSYK